MDKTLIPESRRRDPFRDGDPIVLADGNAWIFPRPRVMIAPRIMPGRIVMGRFSDLGDEFDREIHSYFDSLSGEESAMEFVDRMARIAVIMLRINYRVDDEEIPRLLSVPLVSGRQDEDSLFHQIFRVALGESPKATASGSDAGS